VDVALDRGQDDLALRARGNARPLLLFLHERLEVGDGPLHRACGLHHLREKHLPGTEEIADDLHSVHEGPLDHVERTRELDPRFLRVGLDEVHDAVDESMREPLLDRRITPGEIALALRALSLDA